MTSPFALFRKNQKIMMVALIGMAMFSFVVLGAIDMSSQGGMEAVPAVMGMFLGGVVCWIVSAWVINQKTSGIVSWTVCGCIAGVIIGSFAGGSFGGPPHIVKTKAGGLSRTDIDQLLNQRAFANQFVERSLRAVYGDQQFLIFQLFRFYSFSFGQEQREDVVLGHLLQNEADKMGIAVDDGAVLSFITKMTDSKLTRTMFSEIRKELGISESQLFEILRAELRAKQAFNLLIPRAEPTPEKLWQYYRRLNLSQSCDVIPISVENFEEQVKVPGDEKLKAFFEEHKTVFPGEEEAGSPGFKQPDRIKLAYVKLNYEKVAESIPEISEEDIKAYYEENKENYRSFADPFPKDDMPMSDGPSLGDPKSDDPMSDDPKPDDPKSDDTPKDDKSGENLKPETESKSNEKTEETTEKTESVDPKTGTETSTESKPEANKPTGEKPAEEKPENKEPENSTAPATDGENSSSSRIAETLKGFASLQDDPGKDAPKADPPVESEKKTEQPAKPETQETDNPKSDDPKEEKTDPKPEPPTQDNTEANNTGKGDKSDEKTPAGKDEKSETEKPESEEKEEPPVYRPLDDDLKDEIREQIKQDRTFKKLSELASALRGKMRELGLAHNLEKNNKEYKDAKQVAEALKKYAADNGYKYSETPHVSAEELTEVGRYEIGATVEPGSNQSSSPFEQPTFESTVDIVFATSPDQLYTPFDAEDIDTNDRFVYWKVGHKEEHVPAFDDKGIKAQVASQWKTKEARSLAKQRAKEVAKLIEKAGETEIGEVIADMTETGDKEGTSLVVIGTGSFTWLSQSAAAQATNPFAPRPISLTEVPAILGGASEEFMEIAFNNIKAGGVGVAPNADRSIYFVVKVIDRDKDETLRKRAMDDPAGGMFSGTTQQILREDQGEIHSEFIDALKKQYAVEWIEDEENDSSPR